MFSVATCERRHGETDGRIVAGAGSRVRAALRRSLPIRGPADFAGRRLDTEPVVRGWRAESTEACTRGTRVRRSVDTRDPAFAAAATAE